MRFNPKARLDTSQVSDRRGRGGGGGGGMRLPMPSGGGGKIGLGTVVLFIVIFVINSQLGGGSGDPGSGNGNDQLASCETGADAQKSADCRQVAVVNSIQAFWAGELPKETGKDYRKAGTVVFSGSTSTGCGDATSDVGPFYCPTDETVYLDPTFFKQMLEGQLGAKGGDFAEAYVIAHEYGHHVEKLLGVFGRMKTQQGKDSDSVRLELMADCLAGMWTHYATTTKNASGQVLITGLNDQDISEALDSAQAVGDDRIQKRSGGRVNPDAWTHGSAAERMRWFTTGLNRATVASCNTFDATSL